MSTDLHTTYKSYTDLQNDLQKFLLLIEERKKKAGGNLSQDDVDEFNDKTAQIEGRLIRLKKNAYEIISAVDGSFEKVG